MLPLPLLVKPAVSLRAKLVVLVFAAVMPLLALALFNAWRNAEDAVNRATEQLKFSAALVAVNQLRITDSARQILAAIANAPGLLEDSADDCQRYLKTLNDRFSVYANLGLIGMDGRLRCDGLASYSDRFLGDRDYFQDAIARHSFVAGGYLVSRGLGSPIVTFAMPVLNRLGAVAAVAFVTLDLEDMAKALASSVLPTGPHVAVMDRKGIMLAGAPGAPGMIGTVTASPLLRDAVAAMRTGVGESPGLKGERRIFAFMPVGDTADAAFFVAVSADRNDVLAPVEAELRRVLMVLSLVAALGGLIAWIMARRVIMRPAGEILEAIRSLENGQLEARAPTARMPDGGELFQMAAGFNQMAESLQGSRSALEAELLRSRAIQQRLQDAQRLARMGDWQIEPRTGRILWSDEVYEVLGTSRSVLDGSLDGLVEVIHPFDREAFGIARDKALQAKGTLDIEFRVVTGAGEVRWVHVFGQMHAGIDIGVATRPGAATALPTDSAGVVQDITHRKRSELAMVRSKEMLSRTGALAKVGGWELVLASEQLIWSEQTYRIYERDPSESVTLETVLAHYLPEGQMMLRAAIAAAINQGQSWDMELPLTTARGRHCWIRTQGQSLVEGSKAVRLVGSLHDITAQHEAQQLLRLLETCVSRLNDMVVITDAEPASGVEPHIVFVNEAFERRTGYDRSEILGQSRRLLHGANTQPVELDRIRTALRQELPVRSEQINYTKSGRAYWVELDIVPISDAKGKLTHWVSVERDISLRKAAEQALVDSEQRYAALFDRAPVPMWVFDRHSKQFLTVNQIAVQTYGYSVQEFLSMSILDIHPAEDRHRLAQGHRLPALPQGGTSRHCHKDGSIFPVEIVSRPIQHAGRDACFVVSIDISAKVKAESDMQEHLYTLQRAADAAQAITWHQTLEGTLQEIVDQARGVIGAHQAWVSLARSDPRQPASHARSMSEKYMSALAALGPLGRQHPLDAAEGGQIDALSCQNNRSLRLTDAELQAHPLWRGHRSDRPPLRGWLAVPLMDKGGINVGVLQLSDKYEGQFTQQDEYVAIELAQLASAAVENSALLQEISQLNASLEQKVVQRTAALARQEALFRALAEQAPEVIWTASPEGSTTYVNRTWTRLVGGTPEMWTGNQWFSVMHPDDLSELKTNWTVGQASGLPFVGTRRVLALDGVWHTMSYRASPVFDEQGTLSFWVGIDADITEIKAIETALRFANQELEAFSYSVSHDLRSPLNTVDGFSRLLGKLLTAQNKGQLDGKVEHYLARIQAGVAQMGQLIEDLLSLAQVARTELRSDVVDLSALAWSVLRERQTVQPERQIAIKVETGLQAQGDSRLIRVVLENLLGNAWKFTGQRVNAQIWVGQSLDSAGMRVFFVRDNGVGFDMVYASKLFTPFQRLHAVSEFAGTGIGLATVSRVVSRHGGRIWAEAKLGQGATFFFTLPLPPQIGMAA